MGWGIHKLPVDRTEKVSHKKNVESIVFDESSKGRLLKKALETTFEEASKVLGIINRTVAYAIVRWWFSDIYFNRTVILRHSWHDSAKRRIAEKKIRGKVALQLVRHSHLGKLSYWQSIVDKLNLNTVLREKDKNTWGFFSLIQHKCTPNMSLKNKYTTFS